MAKLASAITTTSTPVSRSQLFIQKLPTASDSSDEARTDTSLSSPMNSTHSPGSGTKCREDNRDTAAAATNLSAFISSGRRRKAETAVDTKDDNPAPKQRKYERKTKRFIWPDDLHRLFVAAIFDVGLKNASPKTLLALMEAAGPDTGLTTEHLKSHLQKYRLHYERSRMEFLEYYDCSAKRNLKRRRQQTKRRVNGTGSEANTMFVFPINNSKRRRGRGNDSDDSNSDSGGSNCNDGSMQVNAKGHEIVRRRSDSPTPDTETHPRTYNYSQFMQNAQHQPPNGHLPLQLPTSNGRMTGFAPARASTNMIPIATHHLPPAYTYAQLKQLSDHDRDLATAAAAVAAHHYSSGQLPASIAEGVAELSALPDPQWSILNSLMSPQLAGMTGVVGEGGLYPQVATSEAPGGNVTDDFMYHEEPSDLQMQMHLAMQAQMNLHRQMLTRKVEVAQHLARHSSMGTIDSNSVSSNTSDPQVPPGSYRESWCNAQQLRHQQYQHQHRQDDQEHFQQQMNLLSRSSLSAAAPDSQASVPTASVRTDTIATAPISETTVAASTSETIVVSTSAPVNENAMAVSSTTNLPTEMKGEDDGIDLYRWDRIDLNVELDDDDLFGFLKS